MHGGRSGTLLGPCPAAALSLGTPGVGGGHFGQDFHLSSCMIFCPGCRASARTEGVAEQAWPGHGCELQLAAPGTLWAKQKRKEPVGPASARAINDQAISWAPIPDGSPLPPETPCPRVTAAFHRVYPTCPPSSFLVLLFTRILATAGRDLCSRSTARSPSFRDMGTGSPDPSLVEGCGLA